MTQSKLGPHAQRSTPDLRRWLEAGARLARLTGDLSLARELAEIHPDALLIGAAPTTIDVALDARHGARPDVTARAFVNAQRELYGQFPQITAWEGPTAPMLGKARDVEALRLMAWYAAFEAERVQELADLGLRAVVGNFATGGPDLPLWSAFLPALDAAERNAGWLGLHEHSGPWLWWLAGPHQPADGPAPTLRDEPQRLAGWATLRHRLVEERVFRPNGIEALPIVITSLRIDRLDAGGGPHPGAPWTQLTEFWSGHDGAADPIAYWRDAAERDPALYVAEQLAWYDSEIQRDPIVVGAAVGIVGADERHAAYELADTAASTWLIDHIRDTKPFGSSGPASASPAPRLVPRGPEPPRLSRDNLLDRRGFDEGWVEDFDLTQELAAPLGWRLRFVEGVVPAEGEDAALPAFGRPFATLLNTTDVRPAERERLFGGGPYVWRVAARTPFHVALDQTVPGLVPGLSYRVTVRLVADPVVRDQPRLVYAPDLCASETRLSMIAGADPVFPRQGETIGTSAWQTGESLPFGRAGSLAIAFTAPADAVTVRLEIRSRYALPLAAWHVQAPTLTPDDPARPA